MQRKWTIAFLMLFGAGICWAQDKPFMYEDHGKRDPLWPLVTPSGAIMNYETEMFVSDMVLEGVIVDSTGKNLAIINGVIVTDGGKVGQYTVKNISPTSVVLIKGEEEFILKLKKED